MQKLCELKSIDLREIWKHEAIDFTNWLAEEENLNSLGDVIGVDIELIQKEAEVGSYRVDILAQDTNCEKKIIIENQLEMTNHDHLGKIITYASGYDAEIVIWIVKDAKSEHIQAIDWLNERTDDKTNFFLIKMEVYQIADSPYAPKFEILCKPNEWAKILKKPTSVMNDRKLKLIDFWTQLNAFLSDKHSTIKPHKPSGDHWNSIAIGTSKAHIDFRALAKDRKVGCDLYIPNNKELYYTFEMHKKEIEDIIGEELAWNELKNKKASLISIEKDEFDLYDSTNWEEFFIWLENKAIKFKKAFCQFI